MSQRRKIYVYLAGTIKKGKEEENEDAWTEEDRSTLQLHLDSLNVIFLNPAIRSDNLADQVSVFGRDLFQVFSSHLVLVDARGKRGLGVGAEMMFAKTHGIPVVAWLPEKTHYHRERIDYLGQTVENWIHPFIYNLCDYLAPTLKDAADWIQNELFQETITPKGPEVLHDAIRHYLETQLSQDTSMFAMVSGQPHFGSKLKDLNPEIINV